MSGLLSARLSSTLLGLLMLVSPLAQAFDLQAHRGGRGLWPENTLVAFESAIGLGVTTLELDIAISADGVPVISHDPALNPAFTRDAAGAWITTPTPLIKSMTLAQLQQFDVGRIDPRHAYARSFSAQTAHDGQRIPSLAALFKRVAALGADHIRFNIETKINPHAPEHTLPPEDFVARLLAVIQAHGMEERVTVQSFDWRALALVHRLAPGLRTAYLSIESPRFNTLGDGAWTAGLLASSHGGSVPRMVRAAAGSARGVVWSPHFENLSPSLVQEARALDLRVIPWTVNQAAQMERLIDWGVDGIITDYPDRLRQVLTRRNLPLPPGTPR